MPTEMCETDLKRKLLHRQVDVQKKNLVQICRFSVKTLIDKSSLMNIDDDCEELINFCAVLEQVLSHNIKVQKTWYRSEEPRQFWHYIQLACKTVPHNCIHSIATLENVKSSLAKGRAWIRCVLMEKRLSEYLSVALQQTSITRNFYQNGAVMLSEDAAVLCETLRGLNAIDFSFCLKGENLELSSPVAIDYTPYLKFHQSNESLQSDKAELQGLSTDLSQSSSIMSGDDNMSIESEESWKNKYRFLEQKYRVANEQKGYLEELARTRGMNLQEVTKQRQTLMKNLTEFENNSRKERHQLEQVIIELQYQMSKLKQQHEIQQKKYLEIMKQLQGGNMSMDEVAGVRPVSPQPWQQQSSSRQDSDQISSSSNEGSSVPVSAARLAIKTTGNLSGTEDSGSTTAMAGSFSSEISARDLPPQISDADKMSKEIQEQYMQSKSSQSYSQKTEQMVKYQQKVNPEVLVTVATPEMQSPLSENISQPLSENQDDTKSMDEAENNLQSSKGMTDSDISDGGQSSKSSESELKDYVVLDPNAESSASSTTEPEHVEQIDISSHESTPDISAEDDALQIEENGNTIDLNQGEGQMEGEGQMADEDTQNRDHTQNNTDN